jgi:hypothetical protein
MRKILRDRLRALAEAGCAIDGIRHGPHTKLHVIDPHGRPLMIVVGQTPNDWRVQRNFAAQLKRLAKMETHS